MKAMKTTPYSTGAKRGIVPAPAPYDFANPVAFDAEVTKRSVNQQTITRYDETGPRSVFEEGESARWRGNVTTAAPDKLQGMIAPLYKLDNGQLFATLNDKEVTAGLQSLIRTNDPAKLRAAMPLIDALDQRDRQEFERVIGEKDADRLRVWQASLSYMTEEQIALKLKRDGDPQAVQVQNELEKSGLTKAKTMTTADIVGKLDPGLFSRGFDRPEAPVYHMVRNRFVGDYRNVFAGYYALNGGNEEEAHDQTVKKMQTKWSRTAAGGHLMQDAPEKYYPKFGNSYEWLDADIEKDLERTLGPRSSLVRISARNDPGGGQLANNWDYQLVPDTQTKDEIARGLPPSYNVVVRKVEDSEWSVFAVDGKPQRWRGNIKAQQLRAEENMEDARAHRWESWLSTSGVPGANPVAP
jgi:hypothetical protein